MTRSRSRARACVLRAATCALLAAGLLVGGAARGDDSVTGAIASPNPYPTAARLTYLGDEDANGLLGYVVDLGRRVADDTPYALKRISGAGAPEFTAWFYAELDGAAGRPCLRSYRSDGAGGETGAIVCGDSNADGTIDGSDRARYAVVLMADLSRPGVGAFGRFKLTWG